MTEHPDDGPQRDDRQNPGGPGERAGASAAPDYVPYLTHVVKTIRGREAITRSKLENDGWEFVSQTPGMLRTEMSFRRPKPKTFAVHLGHVWSVFRRLPATVQRVAGAVVAALVVLVVVVSVVAGQSGGAATADGQPAAGATGPDAVPTSQPAATPPPKASAAASTTPAVTSTEDADDEPADGPSDDPSDEPGTGEILTAKNNKEFAALMKTPDECDNSIRSFAKKYDGRTIEFDGSISAMANHGSYKTRYDIMVSPGDKGSMSAIGANFQFQDVNIFDLNLTGKVPDYVGRDDKLHVVATVDQEPELECLLHIRPVTTRVR